MVKSKEKSSIKADSKKSKIKMPIPKALPTIKNIDSIRREYDLPDENLTPNVIIHKMTEICELYLKIIQQILQPEEFHAVYECNEFNDKDKAELFDLYKRIIILHRELLKAVLMADEKNSLSTIQFAHAEMQGVKPRMLEILSRMQQSWKIDNKKDWQKGTSQYFG